MNLEGSTVTPRDRSWLYKFLYYLIKGFNFLRRYSQQPRYAFTYLLYVWRPNYREKIYFLTDEEFLEEAKNKSTLRLGDGEFTLMLGTRDIIVQKFDPELRSFFYNIAKDYHSRSPYLLALPPHLNIPNQKLEVHDFHYLWMPGKILFRLYFNAMAIYSDASFFYRRGMTKTFLKAVTSESHAIFVTNADNIAKLKQREKDLVPEAKFISYVETPPTNTYELRSVVFEEIQNSITRHNSKPMVVFACGPAGKVLAHKLAVEGLAVAHDVGSGIAFLFDQEDHEWQMKWAEFGTLYSEYRNLDRRIMNQNHEN